MRIGPSRWTIRSERGQVLPLFAISLVAILAVVGLGLDGVRVMLERRDAQTAADLAALSAARLLPADQAGASAMAVSVAASNGFTIATSDVTFPTADSIRVEVDSAVPMLFTPVVDITNTDVAASAVAVHAEAVEGSGGGGGGYAILALSEDCTQDRELDVTSAFYSTGAWHSNSTMYSSSPNNPPGAQPGPLHQGAHTYSCPGGLTIGDDDTSVWDTMWTQAPPVSDPLGPGTAANITPASFTCDYPADPITGDYNGSWTTDFKISADGPHWKGGSAGANDPPEFEPGTICAAKIDWDESDAIGTITAVSSLQIRGSKTGGPLFPHHESGILFAVLGPPGQDPTPADPDDGCKDDKAIGFSSPNISFNGVFYAPCGEVEWTGPANEFIQTSIIAKWIKTSSTGSVVNAYPYLGAGGASESQPEMLALIE